MAEILVLDKYIRMESKGKIHTVGKNLLTGVTNWHKELCKVLLYGAHRIVVLLIHFIISLFHVERE